MPYSFALPFRITHKNSDTAPHPMNAQTDEPTPQPSFIGSVQHLPMNQPTAIGCSGRLSRPHQKKNRASFPAASLL